jgi:catalase
VTGSIRGRKVAIIVADGVIDGELATIAERLAGEGRGADHDGAKLGTRATRSAASRSRSARRSKSRRRWCSMRWCCRTARAAIDGWRRTAGRMEFLKDQYRHCKPIFLIGAAQAPAGDRRHSPKRCRAISPTPA